MAYLRDIRPGKCPECHTRLVVLRLITRYNQEIGDYCRPCGEKKLRERTKMERDEAKVPQ